MFKNMVRITWMPSIWQDALERCVNSVHDIFTIFFMKRMCCMGRQPRIGINIEAVTSLYVVGITTYWRIQQHAFVCIPSPPRKNHTSAMSFSAASHTTYSIIGISLSCIICLQGRVRGSEIQKLPRNPSIGSYSDGIKVCIGFYLDSYSLVGSVAMEGSAVELSFLYSREGGGLLPKPRWLSGWM